MQHNKNSDANVGSAARPRQQNERENVTGKARELDIRERKKDLKNVEQNAKKTLDFLGKVGYNNKRRLKRLKHVRP